MSGQNSELSANQKSAKWLGQDIFSQPQQSGRQEITGQDSNQEALGIKPTHLIRAPLESTHF